MESEKVVWLLGSGFSKPLGGPLLKDLFRQERDEDIRAYFPDDKYPELAKNLPWIQKTFHNGVKEGLWGNAEQYLAHVDHAFRSSSRASITRLENLIKRSDPIPPEVRSKWTRDENQIYDSATMNMANLFPAKVTRALASECFKFTHDSDPEKDEQWGPYRGWIRRLKHGVDTVISFNYDRVVELADQASGCGRIHAVKPDDLELEGKVCLLKLHGSVDWQITDDPKSYGGKLGENLPLDQVLRSPKDRIGIAAPGSSKAEFVDRHFKPLWKMAEAALREATCLMVIGYSFPDTDPGVQRLLNAFENGSPERRHVHIVLGADVEAPAARRVASLLMSAANGRQIQVTTNPLPAESMASPTLNIVRHPLYAQDFIGRSPAYRTAYAGGHKIFRNPEME